MTIHCYNKCIASESRRLERAVFSSQLLLRLSTEPQAVTPQVQQVEDWANAGLNTLLLYSTLLESRQTVKDCIELQKLPGVQVCLHIFDWQAVMRWPSAATSSQKGFVVLKSCTTSFCASERGQFLFMNRRRLPVRKTYCMFE